MAATMLIRLTTAESLRLVTGHLRTASNNEQFYDRGWQRPECRSRLWQDSLRVSFRSEVKNL